MCRLEPIAALPHSGVPTLAYPLWRTPPGAADPRPGHVLTTPTTFAHMRAARSVSRLNLVSIAKLFAEFWLEIVVYLAL